MLDNAFGFLISEYSHDSLEISTSTSQLNPLWFPSETRCAFCRSVNYIPPTIQEEPLSVPIKFHHLYPMTPLDLYTSPCKNIACPNAIFPKYPIFRIQQFLCQKYFDHPIHLGMTSNFQEMNYLTFSTFHLWRSNPFEQYFHHLLVSQISANSATSKWTHSYIIHMVMKLSRYDHIPNRHTHPRDRPHIFLASRVRKNHAITVYFGHRLKTQLPSIALSSHSTNHLLIPNKAIWESLGFLWVTDATVISSNTCCFQNLSLPSLLVCFVFVVVA